METFKLTKNEDGRFECGNVTLNEGDTIELIQDALWVRYQVKSALGHYYLVGPKNEARPLIEGERVRAPKGLYTDWK